MKMQISAIGALVVGAGILLLVWEIKKSAASKVSLGGGKRIASAPIDATFGITDINNALDPTSAAVPGFSQDPTASYT